MGRPKKVALKGDKYGHLTVVDEYEPTPKGRRRVLCECDCLDKNKRIVAVCDLLKGTVDRCYSCVIEKNRKIRLEKIKDEIGKQYGRLIISDLYYDDYNYNIPMLMAHCVCTCEEHNEVDVIYQNLKKGTTSSCGCYRSELTIEHNHNMTSEQRSKLRKHNSYDLTNDYGIGYFDDGNAFTFDKDDFDKINKYYWSPHWSSNGKSIYVVTYRYHKMIPIHQVILGNEYLSKNQYIDHIDRNPLNNTKSNLRFASYSQNSQNKSLQCNNTSGVAGVSYDKVSNKWAAQIRKDNAHYYLGKYDLFEDAVKARLKAEKEYFGEFAPQKHLYIKYGID